MNILLLSPYPENIINTFKKEGDYFLLHNEEINLKFLKENSIDFIVSYGYSQIIKKEIIEYLNKSIINLHISFLPFNRGSHPNLWSFIEGTPSGITIHKINEGIDTGEILFRKKIYIDPEKHTFRSSYTILRREIEIMFNKYWKDIKYGKYEIIKPIEEGTFHLKKEGEHFFSKLKFGWDTNIQEALKEFKLSTK